MINEKDGLKSHIEHCRTEILNLKHEKLEDEKSAKKAHDNTGINIPRINHEINMYKDVLDGLENEFENKYGPF